jgi:hypothetical protein
LPEPFLVRPPARLAPSRPRRRRREALLTKPLVITAPGRATRSVPIAIPQPLLPVLLFLLPLEFLLEILVAVAAVATLGLFKGTLPVVGVPLHRRQGREDSFGGVG